MGDLVARVDSVCSDGCNNDMCATNRSPIFLINL